MKKLRAVAVWLRGFCGGKVATILTKFGHILKIYAQIESKNRYTFKRAKLFTLFFKTVFIFKFV